MANDIKTTLKESTKGMLSDEVLEEIQSAFDEAVTQKASLHVEAALANQDEDHATKVQTLLEAIDDDHTKKLESIVGAINENHTRKLKDVIGKYQKVINEEAVGFKSSMVDNVSKYLDLYLEETFPKTVVQEAVDNTRANNVLEEVKKLLSVDMVLAKSNIKDAILDGKQQIQETSKQRDAALQENKALKARLNNVESFNLLEKLSSNLPEDKKKYVKKVLCDKTEQFIKENFDYTLKLFDKQEDDQNEQLRQEAQESAQGKVDSVVDPVPEVVTESFEGDPVKDGNDPWFNNYMGELGKY